MPTSTARILLGEELGSTEDRRRAKRDKSASETDFMDSITGSNGHLVDVAAIGFFKTCAYARQRLG